MSRPLPALRFRARALALLLATATPLVAQDLPRGFDQGLFEIRIPGNAAVTVPAIVNAGGGLLLPVAAVLSLTGLPEERSHGDSIRSIPEVGGDRQVVLDLTRHEIRRHGQRIPIGEAEVFVLGGETYLLTDRLAEFLQADVTLDWSTLTVVVSRNPPFPVERRQEIESRRSAARERQGVGASLRLPTIAYRSRSGGYVVEWTGATSSQDLVRSFGGQLRLGAAVQGGDLTLGVIHTATPSPDYGRWQGTASYRRGFPTWSSLRQVEAGDIVVGGATFQAVRGINFTNAAIVRDQFFSTVAVEPSVPLGWEYEVYQNGQLIGYSDAATRGAIGIPLRYGTTPVEVRLLSPSGEERMMDMTFLVSPTLIQPGRFEYSTGVGKCSGSLCDAFGYVDLKYGARKWLTLGGGTQEQWGTPGVGVQPYGSANYALFSGWQADVQAARALFSRASVSYYGLSPYNGSLVLGSNSPGVGSPSFLEPVARRWYAEGRLARRLLAEGWFASAVRLEARTEGTRSTPTDHYRLSTYADRNNGSIGLHYEDDRTPDPAIFTVSVLSVLTTFGPEWLHHTAFTTSAGFASGKFRVFDFNTTLHAGRTTGVGVNARWDALTRSGSASLSINSALGFGRSTTRLLAAPKRGSSATTTLSGVATFDPGVGFSTYEMGGIGAAGLGGVIFYDYDADGKLGPGDSVAQGIGLVVGGQRARSDERGRYRVWNIIPYELIEITIDTLKGIAPNWIPLRVQQYTRATPHMYGRFDIPLTQTREVAGQIVADSGVWTSAGINVVFRNIETGQITSSATFSDGAFYVSRMRPGEYEVSIAQSALDVLKANAVPDRVRLSIPPTGVDAVIDMPPIHLVRPPLVIEEVVVTPLFAKRLITLRGVNFEIDKAELTTPSYDVLDPIAKALVESPEIRIEIAGHTDATGSRAHNMTLSQERAEAVRNHFIFKGVDSSRMIARGYGPDEPIASNRTSQGRALNRRTELRRLDEPRDSAQRSADSLLALPDVEYSVEVGTLRAPIAASRLMDRVVKLGFEARIVGDEAPFRVRVGRVATRQEAGAIAAQLKKKGVTGRVVRAELR